jgi:DNA replication protein DnaC
MSQESICQKLRELRMFHMQKSFEQLCQSQSINSLSAMEALLFMCEAELTGKNQSRYQRLVHQGEFKLRACLEEVTCSAERGLHKSSLVAMMQETWLLEKRNIFIGGATGTGKTYLACAIGQAVCRLGYSVSYTRVSVLLEKLNAMRGLGKAIWFREKLAKVKLLILDDFAVPSFTVQETADVMEILEDRHLMASTIISTQLPKGKIHAAFADTTMADAICDRILTQSIDFNLKGESMRKRKS